MKLNRQETFIHFLNGSLAIKIKDFKDYKLFKDFLNDFNMLNLLVKKKEQNTIEYWRNLAYINQSYSHGFYHGQAIIFEHQVGKGITFSWDEKNAIDWWGKESVIFMSQIEAQ